MIFWTLNYNFFSRFIGFLIFFSIENETPKKKFKSLFVYDKNLASYDFLKFENTYIFLSPTPFDFVPPLFNFFFQLKMIFEDFFISTIFSDDF